MTPLLSAAYNANEPIARILIQLGADLTAQDDNGLSVIFHCIQSSINF
jgi:ankyrin repeat protein